MARLRPILTALRSEAAQTNWWWGVTLSAFAALGLVIGGVIH